MTTSRQIVEASDIENRLDEIWQSFEKKDKLKASLFNLIVFTHLSERVDYIRKIVDRVVEKYPSRILFISYDPDKSKDYLKIAVSVVTIKAGETEFACDNIDIGVTAQEIEKVPYVILPHLIPDLPIYLLWAEDPCKENAIFHPLAKLSKRIIFDSESADDLTCFSKTVRSMHHHIGKEIADLNWARMEPWRDLITNHFRTAEDIDFLHQVNEIDIKYNSLKSSFFSHPFIQSSYLQSWIANRLSLEFKSNKNQTSIYQKNGQEYRFVISSEEKKDFHPGAVLSLELKKEDETYSFIREQPEQVVVKKISKEECALPHIYQMGILKTGNSLIKEITYKGTSYHYLQSLQGLNL